MIHIVYIICEDLPYILVGHPQVDVRPGSTAYGMVASTLGRSSEWNKCLQVIQDMKSCLFAAVFFFRFFIKKEDLNF